jgi:hypothetical protein
VSLQYIRRSEDPDAALFRQMEQYVLDHYPNPTRTGCPYAQTLKLLVYEPLTLELRDAKYLHVMECAECMREVIAFRETRMAETGAATPVESAIPISSTRTSASSSPPPLKMHRRFGALALSATAAACIVAGVLIGTHLKPPATHEAGLRSEVVDLSRDGTIRGIEKGPQSLLTKDVEELILELPPLSPEGRYRVTLQSENGEATVSRVGIAKMKDGKAELPVMLNLSGLSSGNYKLAIQGEHDSAPYYYPVVLR